MELKSQAYVARKQAADLGDEARKQYMIYLAAKKRWLAKVEEAEALERKLAEVRDEVKSKTAAGSGTAVSD